MGEWHEVFCDRGERPNCQISGELVAEIFKGLNFTAPAGPSSGRMKMGSHGGRLIARLDRGCARKLVDIKGLAERYFS